MLKDLGLKGMTCSAKNSDLTAFGDRWSNAMSKIPFSLEAEQFRGLYGLPLC